MNDSAEDFSDESLELNTHKFVQTSAQSTDEVVHKEPALGGSYVRNVESGDLVKQEMPVDPKEKE